VIGTSCSSNEYGDILDMMGASHSAHFNAVQKERLGWLNSGVSPPITTVLASGTYTLETFEPVGSGAKALKILKSTDPSTGLRTWYYVESRQAIGFDAFLAGEANNVVNGVLIHTGAEGNGNASYLLDLTPATPVYYWWFDPALAAGQNFSDPTAGVSVTTSWVNGNAAAVTVTLSGSGTTPISALAVSTDQASYTINQPVSIKATVTTGGLPVANVKVSFSVKKPTGAVVTGSATTGTNGVATYKLRLSRKDPVGTYEADATALTRSAAANFTVH